VDKFYIVSLDPAQLHDYSALAVLECSPTGKDNVYRLVSLKRKQRLPYPEIVSWSRRVFLNPKFQRGAGISEPQFVIDAGGVGRAIHDMLVVERLKPIPIQLTGGEAESYADGTYHVSKSLAVGRFLAAWDAGRVQVPANASFLPILENELKAFRGAMTAQGRAKFEAEAGEHDDLVMALAQAVWYFEKHGPKELPRLTITGGTRAAPWRDGNTTSSGVPSWITPDQRRKHAAKIAEIEAANRAG
jgi:hypothetical protein